MRSTAGCSQPSFTLIVNILFIINIINFLDRGIIPGASEEFNDFILDSGISDKPNVFLGLLQSSFIIGYAIASIIFGNLVHHHPPFYLCASGLVVWITAVIFAGLAFNTGSYTCLFLARMISGVGEAAFQITVPPWISKHAPPSQRGLYLSIFFTAIPTGTAIGYAYAAAVATTIGWQYAYFIEAALMSIFVPFLLYIAPFYPCDTKQQNLTDPNDQLQQPLKTEMHSGSEWTKNSINENYYGNHDDLSDLQSYLDESCNSVIVPVVHLKPPSLCAELQVLFSTPVYLCIVAGYAAQTAAVIGLSTFGSSFLIGLGFFDTETQSSTVFGILVCVAGVASTPLGGYVADQLTNSRKQACESVLHETALPKKLAELLEAHSNLGLIVVANLVGTILLCSAYWVTNKALFLLDLFLGVFSLFLSSAGINLAVMLCVPERHRALAIGLSCLGLHVFGDVPSPVLAGLLKDHYAPGCSGGDSNGEDSASSSSASDNCRADSSGLRLTMLLLSSWLFVCVLFMAVAWLVTREQWRRRWTRERTQWMRQSADAGYLVDPWSDAQGRTGQDRSDEVDHGWSTVEAEEGQRKRRSTESSVGHVHRFGSLTRGLSRLMMPQNASPGLAPYSEVSSEAEGTSISDHREDDGGLWRLSGSIDALDDMLGPYSTSSTHFISPQS